MLRLSDEEVREILARAVAIRQKYQRGHWHTGMEDVEFCARAIDDVPALAADLLEARAERDRSLRVLRTVLNAVWKASRPKPGTLAYEAYHAGSALLAVSGEGQAEPRAEERADG